ncbi:MAG: hypothetical protein LBD55_08845 [Treponema sp.]|nr:hypothetical protein [Treponema sp.]
MKPRKRSCIPLMVGVLIALVSSCIGVKADITLRPEGSGTIELEYRLSRPAESLGKLDGNERWPTIPLGRADFERTLARVDGLTLRSFSTKTDGKDIIYTVTLGFSDLRGLAGFLDATGRRAALVQEQGKHRLFLTLISGTENIDPDLLSLFTAVTEGYSVSLSFTAPREGTLTLCDAKENPLGDVPGIRIVPKGRKVSFLSPLGDLFALAGGAGIGFTWE